MITNTTAKMTYTVAQGVTTYAIGFDFDYNPNGTPQIKVYLNKASETPLVFGEDFTITPDQLSIVVSAEIEVGDRLDIIRDIPFRQLSDYIVGRIDPEQIENDFDASVMRDQQLKADMQFAVEIPEDHESRIQALELEVNTIDSYIPTQATSTNQLADKDFVNSSIATATATFRGTYNALEDLEAVTADANDYGFVVSTDAAGNTVYNRYKYNGTAWVFEYALNNSSFTSEQWAAVNSGITADIVASLDNMTGRNVGDIFFTMRTDTGLNGAVECDGTQYNTTDFTGAQSIGALLEAGKLPYVSLSQYATLLSTQGSCGVFGWDGAGTTDFRVPSLNDIFVETGTAAQIGDYIAPGLPNITAGLSMGDRGANITGTGAAQAHSFTSSKFTNLATSASTYDGWDIDASRSSAVYGNSDTVQPNAVRYRAMVQLAVSTTDEALETCTGVLADVSGLKDASNLTSTGKLNIIDMVMPDYANAINNVGYPYTPTKDGIYLVYTDSGSGADTVTVNNVPFDVLGPYSSVRVPVSAGTVCGVTGSVAAYAKFIPFKGA